MCQRVEAASKARRDPNFLIIARTDAAKSLGFNEALRRVQAYYEAGADMVFTSMPQTEEEMAALQALSIPKCVSVVEGTITENYTPQDFQKMGFSLVKYPQTLIRGIIRTQVNLLKQLKMTGKTDGAKLCSQSERADWTHLDRFTDFEDRILSEN